MPGYWFFGHGTSDSSKSDPTDPDTEPLDPYKIDEVTQGYFIKSNRTQSKEDGSFTISSTVDSDTLIVKYRFIDAERNTMEATYINESDNTESGDSSQSEGTENSEAVVVIMKRLIDHEIKINVDVLFVPGI